MRSLKFENLSTEQVNEQSKNLDMLSPLEAARLMNRMDRQAAEAVEQALPQIAEAVEKIAERMKAGGRLIYIGAGTSGRLGVLDASECPPTFGTDEGLVVGLIAGGDYALRHAVERAEDKPELAVEALKEIGFNAKDVLVGISASGYAPYCVGGLDYARALGALTIGLSCNRDAIQSRHADIAIEMPTGAEILSGSTRLRAGTATKMALNMLTTLTMVQLGKVYGNLMVDMRPTNQKLQDRAVRIVQKALEIEDKAEADALLESAGRDVKTAIVMRSCGVDQAKAREALEKNGGFVRRAQAQLKVESEK
ncbi:MAG: N-acetylmuramic acid 6-phosphate etherase [Clostridia bacterium]|nr:N-acetylmuramic acid 6-phosphate etherase [Clostridia bacterium]